MSLFYQLISLNKYPYADGWNTKQDFLVKEEAAEGFIIQAAMLSMLNTFIAKVAPFLQQLGRYRTENSEITVDSGFGLKEPTNQVEPLNQGRKLCC